MNERRTGAADDALAEEAALWVARLQSSDARDEDRRAFADWLARDPLHGEAFNDMQSLWGELEHVPITRPAARKRPVGRRATAVALLALCLTSLALLLLQQSGLADRWQADHFTPVGQTQELVLDDGSRVTLNTDSALKIVFTAAERRIVLLRGEAFFDVAHNAARPFIVETHDLTATALGTRYSVRAADDSEAQAVEVEKGRVEVASGSDRAVLEAGDMASVGETGRIVRAKGDVAARSAWREGKLVFSNQPLSEVLAVLGRYRHGRIIILDDAAARVEISGIFDLHDTDEALHILSANSPVSVLRLSSLLVLVRSQ